MLAQSFSHVHLFCDPMDYSPPGSSVHGILQARILEWVAMPSSRGSSQPRDQTSPWQAVSLPLVPPGKPKRRAIGTLSEERMPLGRKRKQKLRALKTSNVNIGASSTESRCNVIPFLSQPGKYSIQFSRSVVSDSLRPHGLSPIRLLRPWDFPGKSAGVDCHFLLQGIFPTQESNPGPPHCRQTLYHLSHQGSP